MLVFPLCSDQISGGEKESTQIRALHGLAILEIHCTNNTWLLCLSSYNDAIEKSIDPSSAGSFIGSVVCALVDCRAGWLHERMAGFITNEWEVGVID